MNSSGDFTYEYFLTDHLGNIRASFTDDGSGNPGLIQKNVYYPYGILIKNYDASSGNKYLFSGKEFQDVLGLDCYDFGAISDHIN